MHLPREWCIITITMTLPPPVVAVVMTAPSKDTPTETAEIH
jgi:hypothetical protein